MCRAHATVRGLLGALVENTTNGRDSVVDREAGLEHLSRGTGSHVSIFLAVLEPYFRSMETARRTVELTADLGIADVRVIANKVRDDRDRDAIREFCEAHGLTLAAEVPYDETLADAERSGKSPIDHDDTGVAVTAIRDFAMSLS